MDLPGLGRSWGRNQGWQYVKRALWQKHLYTYLSCGIYHLSIKERTKKRKTTCIGRIILGLFGNAFENSSTKIVIEKSSHLFSRSKFYLKDGTIYF